MRYNLFYFNRRGAVCALRKDLNAELLSHEEAVVYRALSNLHPRYFLVMKHIDMKLMLVVPAFDSKRKQTMGVYINGKRFWVSFMTFYVVPADIMEAAPGKYLDYSYKTVTAIYNAHNSVLRSRWRQDNEARATEKKRRRERQHYAEHERKRLAKKELRIPSHLRAQPCNVR